MIQSKYIGLVVLLLLALGAVGQQDSANVEAKFKLDVKDDVLHLKPQRAFGSSSSILASDEENNFTSPGAVYVLTREEIERSGVQSLVEALRLVPGCMVRERSKGNFDVSMSNTAFLQEGNSFQNIENNDVVILIDGVPILQHASNTIWWESLPSISYIDQVEILNGPSAAIFGMASAGGLINIVTRKMPLDKFKIMADGGVDQKQDHYLSVHAESAIAEKLKMNMNVAYAFTGRPNSDYYVYSEDQYLPAVSLLSYQPAIKETNLKTDLSLRKIGIKSRLEYKSSNDFKANLLLEHEDSEAQSAFKQRHNLFLSERHNQVSAATVGLDYKKFRFSTKASIGERTEQLGVSGMDYQHFSIQSKADYPFRFSNIKVRPGVFLNYSGIESLSNNQEVRQILPFRNTAFMSTGAFSVVEFKLGSKFRSLATVSYELFPQIEKNMLAVTLAPGYSIKDNLYLYATAGRSYRSPNLEHFSILDSLENQFNKELKPVQLDNVELGMRIKSSTFFEADVSAFARRYTSFFDQSLTESGTWTYTSNETSLTRMGANLNLKMRLEKVQVRYFMTYANNKYESDRNIQQATPNLYAGFSANYSTYFNKLNFNLLLYTNGDWNLDYGTATFQSNFHIVPYFKASYKIKDESSIYFVAKNFIESASVEYPLADHIPSQFLLGIRLNFTAK